LLFLNRKTENHGLLVISMCPPEGGACSSWIKHGFSLSLRQRLLVISHNIKNKSSTSNCAITS
jgi:hypothetical protein